MPRLSQGNGGSAVVTGVLNTISSKENSYKAGIQSNHGLAAATAERLAIDGDLEKTLLAAIKGGDEEDVIPEAEIRAFMEEQRGRLKKLADSNCERERDIDLFLGAMGALKQQVAAENGSQEEEGGNHYQERIKELMDAQAANGMQIDAKDSKYAKEIRDSLGEQDTSTNDDDLVMVRNNNGESVSLKCPVTYKLMEDAVKNKVCGHHYSRVGIMSLINNNKRYLCCECPYSGCANLQVTQDQLEGDVTICQVVKRKIRREQAESSQRMMSQQGLDSDDVDDVNTL